MYYVKEVTTNNEQTKSYHSLFQFLTTPWSFLDNCFVFTMVLVHQRYFKEEDEDLRTMSEFFQDYIHFKGHGKLLFKHPQYNFLDSSYNRLLL